jgi:hypothetical protein
MMKNGILLVLTFILLNSLSLQAQKVKIKKGIVEVNKEEWLKINNDYGNEIISTLSGEDLIKVEWVKYQAPNPARNNTNNPGRHNYSETVTRRYAEVTFLEHNIVFETKLPIRKFLEAFYKENAISKEGEVDREKSASLAEKIHQNISGNRPVIIFGF